MVGLRVGNGVLAVAEFASHDAPVHSHGDQTVV
jgi:hypothetical protein